MYCPTQLVPISFWTMILNVTSYLGSVLIYYDLTFHNEDDLATSAPFNNDHEESQIYIHLLHGDVMKYSAIINDIPLVVD